MITYNVLYNEILQNKLFLNKKYSRMSYIIAGAHRLYMHLHYSSGTKPGDHRRPFNFATIQFCNWYLVAAVAM